MRTQLVTVDWQLRTLKNDSVNKAVGKRVKRLRQEKDLSQLQLAKLAKVTANTLRGLEKGTLNTRWPKLTRIAQALGTTAEALIHGDDEVPETDPLKKDLKREDYRIAQLYHHAETDVRNLARHVLNEEVIERAVRIAVRLSKVKDQAVLDGIEQMIDAVQGGGETSRDVKAISKK